MTPLRGNLGSLLSDNIYDLHAGRNLGSASQCMNSGQEDLSPRVEQLDKLDPAHRGHCLCETALRSDFKHSARRRDA